MIVEKIQQDLKSALFAKDEIKVSTLRMLLSDSKNLKIEKQRELTDEDFQMLLERSVKRHRESIEGFEKGNRPEMAEKEKRELEILQSYLPEQMSESDIVIEVEKAISSSGASSIAEIGKVMGALSHLRGKADFSIISKLVKDKLS